MGKGRILIIDDMPMNLQVACGLLEPYDFEIDTAGSGLESVEKLRSGNQYDLIFMDHMMPVMDGVETVRIIRNEIDNDHSKKVPIIALTANALAGIKKMFLENGFNDFLSKPIDVNKLDDIIRNWVPADKIGNKTAALNQNDNETAFLIPGIDTKQGIAMTGGTEDGYRKVLAMFCRDIQDRMSILNQKPDIMFLPLLTTQIHAIKSALATLGATEVSEQAAALEEAGKTGNIVFVREKLHDFVEQLNSLIKVIQTAMENY